MPTLVRERAVARDDWTLLEAPVPPAAVRDRSILPLAAWLEHGAALDSPEHLGVWMAGDTEPEACTPFLDRVALVAIHFPAFTDGRGISLGMLLRSRHGFDGELRAYGDILPDLVPYLNRSGFDAFVLADERAAKTAIAAMSAMTDHYQGSVRQPLPAFRRQAKPST